LDPNMVYDTTLWRNLIHVANYLLSKLLFTWISC